MAASVIGNLPSKVQVGELFRLELVSTYVHVGDHSIQSLVVTVDGTDFTIGADKVFDYDFSSEGTKTLTVVATSSGSGHPTATKDFTIEVVTASTEKLFSKDEDLSDYEPDILSLLPAGKADYRFLHRRAQKNILAYLDETGIHDDSGDKLTIADIPDVTEFERFSTFMVLRMIMEGLSNQVGDIWHEKYLRYKEMEDNAKNRVKYRIDTNNDGVSDDFTRNLTRGMFRT